MKIKSIKRKSIKRKSIKRKSIKRKLMKGGDPKFNFAYVYQIITNIDLAQMDPRIRDGFYRYFHQKEDECNSRATGQSFATDPSLPLINDNQQIILMVKYDTVVDLRYLIDFSLILGHAILDFSIETTRNIIGIYSVCLEKTEKTGYGSVIFNLILTYLELKYLPTINPFLWLGVVVDNSEFDKVSYIYTSFGFAKPFITFNTPFGPHHTELVSLIKPLRHTIIDESTAKLSYHKTISMKNQYTLKKTDPAYTYKFKFVFDKSFILKARLLPYIDVHGQITNKSSDVDKGIFREMSGSLKIYNSEIFSDGDVVYRLSFETIENSTINVRTGEMYAATNIADNAFSYHTHPFGAYRGRNTLIGSPSSEDMAFCFMRFLNYVNNQEPLQCHLVITLEGIYIISLSDYTILYFDAIKQRYLPYLQDPNFVQNFNSIYEYPPANRYFDWSITPLGDDVTIVNNAIQSYLTWFNIQNKLVFQNDNDLFKLQFFPWKVINKNNRFEISIPSIYGSCIVPSDDYNIISYLLGPDYTEFNTLPIPGAPAPAPAL